MSNPHGFTRREQLADWISGGTYAIYRESARTEARRASIFRDEYTNEAKQVDLWRERCLSAATQRDTARAALKAIHDATKDGKSGTAKMVARMSREALE